jgi:hypothetical protein
MRPFSSRLRRTLPLLAGVLTGAGLAAEVALYAGGRRELGPLVAFLSLSYEGNLPTWYASALLLLCALVLAAVAGAARRAGEAGGRAWGVLAAVFAFLSLDEAVGLHEHLALLELSGVLFFSWVVPAAALVLAGGALCVPFLRALPPRRRGQFLLAAALYVGGALLMELPLGWWTERAGNDNLPYALIDHVEEALELLGAGHFLAALVEELEGRVQLSLRTGRLGAEALPAPPAGDAPAPEAARG